MEKNDAFKRKLSFRPLYNGIETAYNADSQFQPRIILINSVRFGGAEMVFGGPIDIKMKRGKKSSYAARHYICTGPSGGNFYGATFISSGNDEGSIKFSPSYGIRYMNDVMYADLSANKKITELRVNADIKIGRCILNPLASIKIPHKGRPGKKKLGKYIETQLNIPLWKHIKGFLRHEIYNDNKQGFVAGVSANL